MPHHYQGYSWQRERDERTLAKRKREREKTKMRAQKKGRQYSFFFLFLPSFLSFFIDSKYPNYLQFRSNGRIARNTFRWKIIVTVTFIQKWFASMHSTTISCSGSRFIICTMLLTMWWCRWYIMMRIESTCWWWWTIHIKTKIDEKNKIYLILFFICINHFMRKWLVGFSPTPLNCFLDIFFQMLIRCLTFFSLETKVHICIWVYVFVCVCKCHSNLINKRISDNRRRR